jgi:hypothetical protein
VDEPIVADSALKHGLTRDAILHAFRNPIRAYDVDDGFTLLIGTGPSTDLLEVGVVSGSEAPVIVHAMRARQRFLD